MGNRFVLAGIENKLVLWFLRNLCSFLLSLRW